MAVYMVAEVKVKDQAKYDQYLSLVSDMIPKHEGRILVRGDLAKPLAMGGEMKPDRRQSERMIILEFPSEVHIRRFFASPEYHTIASLRQEATDTRWVLLEGYKPKHL
jgi:uncharacterized protein (DUF1330 family)